MRVVIHRHLLAAMLAIGVLLGLGAAAPAEAAGAPGVVAAQVQTVQYYYGRGYYRGPRRFYGRPYYARRFYGPGPRFYGRGYYGRPYYGRRFYR